MEVSIAEHWFMCIDVGLIIFAVLFYRFILSYAKNNEANEKQPSGFLLLIAFIFLFAFQLGQEPPKGLSNLIVTIEFDLDFENLKKTWDWIL